MLSREFFEQAFETLTGNKPMGWQQRLFEQHFVHSDIPSILDIPTGLGKTSVIVIWLLALAWQAENGGVRLPRRLVYVVNRRTVVDQATDTAEELRRRLHEAGEDGPARGIRAALRRLCVDPEDAASPLAISTLRGELADNREWQADPARAGIIIGTVDMIGSRLLFSGYGAGRSYGRAQSAGLLGHDALIVHDEAHLSPAFGTLIKHIAGLQRGEKGDRPLRVMELSATQRGNGSPEVFGLAGDDWKEPLVEQRVKAKKALQFHTVQANSRLVEELADKARQNAAKNARVLVYVQKPELASDVAKLLRDGDKEERKDREDCVGVLTGTVRGWERDRLVSGEGHDPTSHFFPEFRAAAKRLRPETLFLVSTSAGEVGVDLDADHLVCDLATLDSMVQRLGRVNRLGRTHPDFVSQIDVLDAPAADDRSQEVTAARTKTREALMRLPPLAGGRYDASPAALRRLLDELGTAGVKEAFRPEPRIVPCTDILLDNWALTSVRELPGRPPVDKWLHGVESELPETVVAWRAEAKELTGLALDDKFWSEVVDEWFDAHPILARERLRDRSDRVAKQIGEIANRHSDARALLIVPSRPPQRMKLSDAADKNRLGGATLILPIEVGGFDHDSGMLAGKKEISVTDVADAEPEPAARCRLRLLIERAADESWSITTLGFRCDDLASGLADQVPDEARFERVLKESLETLNRGRKQKDRLVQKGLAVTLDEDDEGVRRAVVSIGLARSAETMFGNSAGAPKCQTLSDHLDWTEAAARRIAQRVGLSPELAQALQCAARWHDRGKDRDSWQSAIDNRPPRDRSHPNGWTALAKTDHGRWKKGICDGYRHELGSLIETTDAAEFRNLTEAERELALHLIAAHHGWARPHFAPEAIDLEASDDKNHEAMMVAIRRYTRLQRRYGHWRLAWLEALIKASDAIASARGEGVSELPS